MNEAPSQAASPHFERAVLYDCNSVVREHYERVEHTIFEKDPTTSKIEVWCQSSQNLDLYRLGSRPQEDLSGNCTLPSSVTASYPSQTSIDIVNLNTARLENFLKVTRYEFRVFYLRQRHSLSRIQLSKELFDQLLDQCHVFPKFRDFVIAFGYKTRECEVGPPPLRLRFLLETEVSGAFECAYALRFIEYTNRPDNDPWSLRQYAVYHRHIPAPQGGCSTWIILGASQRTESCLQTHCKNASDWRSVHPFTLHVAFIYTAISSWREYLKGLVEQVIGVADRAAVMMIGKEDHPENLISVDVEDYQRLKRIEDRTADILLCLDSTSDTISTLISMNTMLYGASKCPHIPSWVSGLDSWDLIALTLEEKRREVAYARQHAEALRSKVQNTRTLISSLLERQRGYNLQNIEIQTQEETAIMRELAQKNSRDSASVKILTIITLIYLPCTVVSSFYSTQFVNRKESPSGGVSIEYARNSWLFFALSVPLTLITIMTWYVWANFARLMPLCSLTRSNQKKSFCERTRVFEARKRHHTFPR